MVFLNIIHCVSQFFEGLAAITANEKDGYIDINGNEVITPTYNDARSFSEGLAAVKIKGKYGFINQNNEIVIKPAYDDVWQFSNGLAAVKKGKKWGFIDQTGKLVIKCTIENIRGGFTPEGYCRCSANDRCYFINREGKTVFDDGWYNADDFKYGVAKVIKPNGQGKYGWINTEGKLIVKYKKGVSYVDEDGFIIYSSTYNSTDTVYDLNGKELLTGYDSIHYGEGYFTLIKNNYLTIVDKDLNAVF